MNQYILIAAYKEWVPPWDEGVLDTLRIRGLPGKQIWLLNKGHIVCVWSMQLGFPWLGAGKAALRLGCGLGCLPCVLSPSWCGEVSCGGGLGQVLFGGLKFNLCSLRTGLGLNEFCPQLCLIYLLTAPWHIEAINKWLLLLGLSLYR